MKNSPRIFAHRGALLNAPENTIAAFRLALKNGADGFECDVRRTRDGEFVLFHDKDMSRVAGLRRRVEDIPFKQFREVRVFGKEPTAHLGDMFTLLARHPGTTCFFDLELEERKDVEAFARAVGEAGLAQRSYALTFAHKNRLLHYAHEACPELGISVMPLAPVRLLETARAARAKSICAGWNHWWVTKQWFKLIDAATDLRAGVLRASEAGIDVTGGVANTPEEVRWFAERGVSGIWTDDVPMTREALHGG